MLISPSKEFEDAELRGLLGKERHTCRLHRWRLKELSPADSHEYPSMKLLRAWESSENLGLVGYYPAKRSQISFPLWNQMRCFIVKGVEIKIGLHEGFQSQLSGSVWGSGNLMGWWSQFADSIKLRNIILIRKLGALGIQVTGGLRGFMDTRLQRNELNPGTSCVIKQRHALFLG